MTVSTILQQLGTPLPESGDYARYGSALSAALGQREAVIPSLLRAIDEVVADPLPYLDGSRGNLHIFAIYLVAHLQERQALAPLVRLFSLPGDLPIKLTGSLLFSHGAAVLASVCGGESTSLLALVQNESVNSLVRERAARALLVQFLWAERPREAVLADLKTLFRTLRRPGDLAVWTALVESAFDLPAPELEAEMQEVLSNSDELDSWCAIEVVSGQLHDGNPWRLEELRASSAPIDALASAGDWLNDRIQERHDWPADEGDDDDLEGDLTEEEVGMLFGDLEREFSELSPGWEQVVASKPLPYVAPPKVGRNDPCPCGSGKKHKKCCGGV